MRRIALMLFLAVTAITLSIGLADAGTYTVKWTNVTSINDTLNLNFVSTISNATLTISPLSRVDVFPLTAATTEPAQYCIKISGNWINITNSTGYLKASFYDSNFWKYVNSTGADIRITNQSSPLFFWIQYFNATTQTATIWVNLTAGSKELDIYYGNPFAQPTSYNNASKTFIFYGGNSLEGWTVVNVTVNATEGLPPPCLEARGGTYAYINAHLNTTKDYVIRYDVNVIPGTKDLCNLYFFVNKTGYGQMFRTDSRALNPSGFATTTSWTSWNILSGTTLPNVPNGTWLTVQIVTHGTYAVGTISGITGEANNTIVKAGPYIAVHGDASVVTGGLFDNIMILSTSDPATFGTPYQTLRRMNVTMTTNITVGTFTTTSNATIIAVPTTAFSQTTQVKIYPIKEAYFNATLTFNYAYSSTTTVIDTGTVIEKSFTVNTSGLTVPLTLNVTFPLRTKAYKLFVSVSPTTTVTNTTTNTSVITSYILQNNTTYTIDERIGYLIASFTGKDELTGSTLSSITVNYTSSTGWKSVSGPTVSIYGTDLPLHQTETVIEFSSTSYTNRHYILDCTKLNQSITLYLLADSSATMITYTVVSGTSTLPNAKVEIYKYIGNNYVLIDSQYTDASGVVAVPLHAFDTYMITASKPGYDTITATITVTQSTYTIKLGGVSLAIPASHRVVIMFKPSQSTLQPGNNTISVEVIPQGTTVTTATMTVYVNNTQVATVTKSDITTPTTLSTTVNLNQSSSVSVEVSYIENGQTITTRKNYTVPLATGMWAALLLMNQQLIRTPNGKSIGMLIAAFIALAVVAGLAATTNTTARGLGLVGLIVFTIIALPLNAIPLNILIVVWVAVLASWVVWRWI